MCEGLFAPFSLLWSSFSSVVCGSPSRVFLISASFRLKKALFSFKFFEFCLSFFLSLRKKMKNGLIKISSFSSSSSSSSSFRRSHCDDSHYHLLEKKRVPPPLEEEDAFTAKQRFSGTKYIRKQRGDDHQNHF